jgi:hypothetical protein
VPFRGAGIVATSVVITQPNDSLQVYDGADLVVEIDGQGIIVQTTAGGAFVAMNPNTVGITLNDTQTTNDSFIRVTTVLGVHRLRLRAPFNALANAAQIDIRDDDIIGLQCQALALDEATQAAGGPVGAIVGKVEVTDDAGATIGFLPVYDAIP